VGRYYKAHGGKVKNLIIVLLLLFYACSGVTRNLNRERKDQDKIWRPCQDFEVRKTESKDPVGKLCNRVCTKRRGRKCRAWKQNVRDFSKESDFNFFRNGSFIFIDEDSI